MEKSDFLSSDTARPDFVAFDAGVRTRLAQRHALPPEAIAGVERLGRLVKVLRIKQRWSLEVLAAHTGLSWLWLALLEQGVLLPTELTPETLQKLGKAFPLHNEGSDPVALFHTLAEDLYHLRLDVQEMLASDTGESASPPRMPQEAREEEAVLARHLRLLNTRWAASTHRPITRWYGASTELLTDFVRLDRMAASSKGKVVASSEAEATGERLIHLEEGRVTATVRLTADRQLAVALETQDPQCAERQWGFRVTREDGTELYRAAIALQLYTEQPGLWEGRVEVPLTFPEGCGFEFYSLPNDRGDMP